MPIQFTSKDVVIFNGFDETVENYPFVHFSAFLIACRRKNGSYIILKNRFNFDKRHYTRILNKVFYNSNNLQFIVNSDGSDCVNFENVNWVKEGF